MLAVFVGGRLNGQRMDVEEVEEIASGHTTDYTQLREHGICVPRAELDNQPIVQGYIGPMWDGGKLRYETQYIYDRMSM